MMAMGLVGRRLRRLLHPASATEPEVSRKWTVNGLRVANSIMGFSGILILLYSLLLIGIAIRHRHLSWFPLACLIAGGSLSLTACIGHVSVTHARTRFAALSSYILLLFILLIVETLIGLDVMLNDNWDEDFPKDKSDMFDDFVDMVDSNSHVFRLMWTLLLLAQVTCFVIGVILKSPTSGHFFRSSPANEPLLGANPPFVSNKYAEY